MSRMTKAQQKRMVRDINSKAKKLYGTGLRAAKAGRFNESILSVKDMEAIEKLTSKWLERIG